MKNILYSIALLYATLSLAQEKVKDHQFKINPILGPSIEYEMGLSEKISIGAQIGTELFAFENTVSEKMSWVLLPTLDVYARYYYNFSKRKDKGKITNHNAANYIGATTTMANVDWVIGNVMPSEKCYIHVGPVWGIQRTYWKRLSFNLELGVGYTFSDLQQKAAPIGGIHLGWIII